MRNVTIKRRKSFVGCLLKARVYVRDELYPDTYINRCPYRFLGILRNGEEQTFLVPDEAVEILVASDPLMKGVYNDRVCIEAGIDPVVLSGSCEMGLGFVFDGVANEQRTQTLKKKKKKGIIFLIVSVIIGVVLGNIVGTLMGNTVGSLIGSTLPPESSQTESKEPKEFAVHELRISLTEAFSKMEIDGFSACYANQNTVVMVLREDFSNFDGAQDYTLEEYGNLLLTANELTEAKLTVSDNMGEFQYSRTNSGTTYRYFSFIYKSEQAFWFVQFGVEEVNADATYDQCRSWAQTVTFAENV